MPRPCSRIHPLLLLALLGAVAAGSARAGTPYGATPLRAPAPTTTSGPQGDCGHLFDPVVNCGFEAPTLTGWQASDITNPLIPLMLVGEGYDTGFGFGFFLASPTQGAQALFHGFDGSGPGAIEVSQDIDLDALTTDLVFDYRAAWDLLNYGLATQPRRFRVMVEPAGGGVALLDTLILQANPDTRVADTGPRVGRVNLRPFAGQSVRVVFHWWIPETASGPGQFQLDDVYVDGPSIQRFLDLAAPGDTVRVPAGTWSGAGNVALDFGGKDVLLLAEAGPDSTVIDCGDTTRAFVFTGGETPAARVEGFTLRRGRADGAEGGLVRIDGASPTFAGCVLDSGTARRGGAVAVVAGDPEFLDCVFTANRAEGAPGSDTGGGAAYVGPGAEAMFTSCIFDGNGYAGPDSARGGALLAAGAATLDACLVTANLAGGDGGGLHGDTGSSLVLLGGTVTGNQAAGSGGGVSTRGALTATGTEISFNTAGTDGGGVATDAAGTVDLDGGSLHDNTASRGGGAALTGAGGSLTATDLLANLALAGEGAGLFVETTLPVTVAGGSIRANTGSDAVRVRGGGIDLDAVDLAAHAGHGLVAHAPVTVTGCVLAGHAGAAVVMRDTADLLLLDSRITGNLGGVRADSASGTWTIDGCTLAGNDAPDQGGAVRISAGSSGTLALVRSIVWGNSALGAGAELWSGAAGVTITVDDTALRLGKVASAGPLVLGTGNLYWDPVYCAPLDPATAPTEGGDYTLAANSPATAANHVSGTTLGAENIGCSHGSLVSIVDVPGDQGGQVYVTWERALQDDFFAEEPITQYSLWRRIEEAGIQAAAAPEPGTLESPPGNWAFLFAVPASTQPTYTALAATTCDSSVHGACGNVFLVRAHTAVPAAVYDSPPDSGFSRDNLAPGAPSNVAFQSPGVITWDPVPDPDRESYSLYGSVSGVFDGSASLLEVVTTESAPVGPTFYNHFFVTATDSSGNEGPPAGLSSTVSTPDTPLPAVLALHAASPNPFRASTRIAFDLPEAASVRLEVFDLAGRSVRVLENGMRPAGRHTVTWDGRTAHGTTAATGIYFVRFVADGESLTGKLALRR